jgi:glucosamine-6-phosphate deaminase
LNLINPLVLPDDLAVGHYAAEIIFTELVRAKNEDRPFVLGCPGGRTPRSTYNALSAMIKAGKQDISHVVIAMMDEFLQEKPDGTYTNHGEDKHFSCVRFAKFEIFDVLNSGAPEGGKIPAENVRFPEASDPQGYEDYLREVGVDVFLMASGASDGHVAFNPPGTEKGARTRIVRIADETRQDNLGTFPDFKNIDEVPKYGVSVGPATMIDVSEIVIMELIGSHKNLAFKRISAATGYESDWPSTVVRECKDYYILADRAAAKS